MRFKIRPAALEDSKTLFGLIKANAVELGGNSLRFMSTLTRVERQLRLMSTIQDERGVRRIRFLNAAERIAVGIDDPDVLVGYFVAESFPTTLGYVSFSYGESSWYGDALLIEDLYVLPNARRQSIGRALFRVLYEHGEQRGKCRVETRTQAMNAVSVFFLEKMAKECSPRGRRTAEFVSFRFELISQARKGK